jgi:hypothetical protein
MTPHLDLDETVRWLEAALDLEHDAHLAALDDPGSPRTGRLADELQALAEPGSGVRFDFSDVELDASDRVGVRDRVRRRTLIQVLRYQGKQGHVDVAYVTVDAEAFTVTYFARWFVVVSASGPAIARRDGGVVGGSNNSVMWEPIEGRSVGRLGALVDGRQFVAPKIAYEQADYDAITRRLSRLGRSRGE